MVHRNTTKKCGIGIAILLGMMLLVLSATGVSATDPAVNITCTTTPDSPTDMEITQTGVASINITWEKGPGANITIVRGSTLGYPFSVFDGDAIYSGNGTSAPVSSLDLATYTYYYRAWSQNNYGTSTGYDQTSIGHGTGDDDDGTSAMGILDLSLTGDGFGLLEMIFVIALIFAAFMKKGWIRILLSVVIIIWGVFALQYDIKVAAPLLAIGTYLFFTGIMNRISEAKQAREES